MSDDKLRTYLSNHPRTLGTLFGLTVLLSQTAPAAAQVGIIRGP